MRAVGEGQDTTGHSSTARVSLREAAERLGTTVDAIRKRVQRDTIAHEKDSDGRVWIFLDAGRTRQDTDRTMSLARSYLPRTRPYPRSGSSCRPSAKPTPRPVGCWPPP